MPVALQLNPRSRTHTCPARIPISSNDETFYANHDAVHATECHAPNLSEANPSGKANGEPERRGQRSNPVLEERSERNVHAQVNDLSEEEDSNTVDSPSSTSTWAVADTRDTSLAPSPQLKAEDRDNCSTPEDRHAFPGSPDRETPPEPASPFALATQIERTEPLAFAPNHPSHQPHLTVPHLSCEAARRHAYIRQSAIRTERLLYRRVNMRPPFKEVIPPLRKSDQVSYSPDYGGCLIIRGGNRKPHTFRDFVHRKVVEPVQFALGLRDREGWDGMQTAFMEGQTGRSVPCFGERCLIGVVWAIQKVGFMRTWGSEGD